MKPRGRRAIPIAADSSMAAGLYETRQCTASSSESRLSVIAVDSTQSPSVDFVKDIHDRAHIDRSLHWAHNLLCDGVGTGAPTLDD